MLALVVQTREGAAVADRLVIPAFYLACVTLALGAAVWSRSEPLIKTTLVLLAGWAAHNFIVETQGAEHAPLLIPTADAILGLLVAGIAAHHQSRVAAAVFALFLLVQIVHVAAFRANVQGGYVYFLTLNLLFLTQLAVAGGSGVALVIARLNPAPRMADRFSRSALFARRRARVG